jgi:multidrug efflux pump subunit AcrA (membrane-fusion protein)
MFRPLTFRLQSARHGWLSASLLAGLVLPACSHEHKTEVKSVSDPPTIQLLRAEPRDIVRVVGQPSFVEAYERTSIYPKLTAYIEKWNVDIGDKVQRDQVLADLFVPEIIEDWKMKGATVEYDKKRVELTLKTLAVARADVEVAEARVKAANATWKQNGDEASRWESEVKRLQNEVDRGVVDPQVLLESQNRLRGSVASREAAEADIVQAKADLQSKNATVGEDEVAVKVAMADVEVADSDYKRLGAWADDAPGQKPYIKLYAPFDGVVVARNANTWDFVLPAAGDPSADQRAPYQSPSGQATPIYVVERTDVVRIFVDIPEHDANYVDVGSKAIVLIKAFRDQPILGSVTRTSWALQVSSRTLRAEIDLPNTNSPIPDDVPKVVRDAISQVKLPDTVSQILPGMYAYGKVIIERPQVHALPATALKRVGDRTFCFIYEDGKAVRTEVQTGLSDTKNKWIEVTNRRRVSPEEAGVTPVSFGGAEPHTAMDDETSAWVPFDGSEQVILGDLSVLTDGESVHVMTAEGASRAASPGPHGI